MPDITSPKPVPGAPIESAWGGEIHDACEGIQSGQTNMQMNNQSAVDVTVVFARPYETAPVVCVSTIGTSAFVASVKSVTPTQAILTIFHRDGTAGSSNPSVFWLAVPRG